MNGFSQTSGMRPTSGGVHEAHGVDGPREHLVDVAQNQRAEAPECPVAVRPRRRRGVVEEATEPRVGVSASLPVKKVPHVISPASGVTHSVGDDDPPPPPGISPGNPGSTGNPSSGGSRRDLVQGGGGGGGGGDLGADGTPGVAGDDGKPDDDGGDGLAPGKPGKMGLRGLLLGRPGKRRASASDDVALAAASDGRAAATTMTAAATARTTAMRLHMSGTAPV
nr:unnamed protein product [Digitaria exilis]